MVGDLVPEVQVVSRPPDQLFYSESLISTEDREPGEEQDPKS